MVLAGAIFSTFLLGSAAKPGPWSMVVHETRTEPARGFVYSGLASSATELTLRIGLKSNNITGLEEALYAVSDPASALYRQYLTANEVAGFVRPIDETSAAVKEWLLDYGIPSKAVTPAGDVLQIVIPVIKANEILSTQFSDFTHIETGTTSIRTLEYSIPSALLGHIDFVHPTTSFTPPIRSRPKFTAVKGKRDNSTAHAPTVSNAVPASCASDITPACLQAIYNIPVTAATQSANKLGVSGFLNQWANLADLQQFLMAFRPDISPSTVFTLQTLDGGSNQQTQADAGLFAALDIQYAVGVATGVPITFLSVGENNPDGVDGFMDIITALISQSAGTRPNVLTTGYFFDEDALSRSVANQLCNSYMQLGALGTSILFSSGDGGVGGSQFQACTTFIPTFPSSCPLCDSPTTSGFQVTKCSMLSRYRDQSTAVAAYLNTIGSTNSGRFNRSGRGFPDLSARATNFEIVWGEMGVVGGTGGSSSTVAAIIALLNDELIAVGQPPLGFLNPLLYSAAGTAALNDIKTGDNPGCGTSGFPATTGWDPITGLGSPDYARLQEPIGITPLPPARVGCNFTVGLCFELYVSPVINTTVGFALPPEGSEFVNEAMIFGMFSLCHHLSFPLPYGYAGTFLGIPSTASGSSAVPAINWWFEFPPLPIFAETTSLGANNTLFPLTNGQINATFSPLVKENATHALIIFRCQNCEVVTNYFASAPEVKLTSMISPSMPEFINGSMTLANLPLAGEESDAFLLNTTTVRFANYSAMLAAAGLL
ncbi:peptidase S8/S53 domain-containing protein [Mycena galericulata]|nr:peptidase S8/S53 domain-containing protein [Mycena galericulata]